MKRILPFLFLICTSYAEYTVKFTAFCKCQKCCSWHYNKDGKPVFNHKPNKIKIIGQTASGKIAKEGITLAMPKQFPFGTKLYLNGKLLGICQDRGGKINVKDKIICIDIYMDSHQKALEYGVKYIKKVENVSGFL